MARIDWVEARLREWGEWIRSEGRCDKGAGYPTRNCLDIDWGRPGQGAMPSFKVVTQGRGGETHACLRCLSLTLQLTLDLHYARGKPVADIATLLATSRDTITKRIDRAHMLLAGQL